MPIPTPRRTLAWAELHGRASRARAARASVLLPFIGPPCAWGWVNIPSSNLSHGARPLRLLRAILGVAHPEPSLLPFAPAPARQAGPGKGFEQVANDLRIGRLEQIVFKASLGAAPLSLAATEPSEGHQEHLLQPRSGP